MRKRAISAAVLCAEYAYDMQDGGGRGGGGGMGVKKNVKKIKSEPSQVLLVGRVEILKSPVTLILYTKDLSDTDV